MVLRIAKDKATAAWVEVEWLEGFGDEADRIVGTAVAAARGWPAITMPFKADPAL